MTRYHISTYAIDDLDGSSPLEEDIPKKGLSFTRILSGADGAGWGMPRGEPETPGILPGRTDVRIFRDSDLRWGGRCYSADRDSALSGSLSQFTASGWYQLFRDLVINTNFSRDDMDMFEIVSDLIDYANTKEDTGITLYDAGATRGFVGRPRTWKGYEDVSVADAIEDLAAEVNKGFSFEVTPDKKWRNFAEGADQSSPTFGVDIPISSLRVNVNALEVTNYLIGRGQGSGRDQLHATKQDAASQALYGKRMRAFDWPGAERRRSLEGIAERELARRKGALTQPTIRCAIDSIDPGDLVLGDNYPIDYSKYDIDLDDMFRLVTMQVEVSERGAETVTCTFDAEITTEEMESS